MTSMPLSTAQRVIDAAMAKAVEIGQPMNIAVVDDGAHLVAFVRMDGAIKASIDISIRKATTSIMMNAPTGALMGLAQPGAELYGLEQTSGGLVLFGGGVLLESSGGSARLAGGETKLGPPHQPGGSARLAGGETKLGPPHQPGGSARLAGGETKLGPPHQPGTVIGAVGVSAGSVAQDVAVAEAGAAAINATS